MPTQKNGNPPRSPKVKIDPKNLTVTCATPCKTICISIRWVTENARQHPVLARPQKLQAKSFCVNDVLDPGQEIGPGYVLAIHVVAINSFGLHSEPTTIECTIPGTRIYSGPKLTRRVADLEKKKLATRMLAEQSSAQSAVVVMTQPLVVLGKDDALPQGLVHARRSKRNKLMEAVRSMFRFLRLIPESRKPVKPTPLLTATSK